ncbi:ATP-binding protein [Streptomyces sp. NPDC006798]|uniref:ATP-binding protein n=1 Tax=Streptomyces sp. NPDC006798 TaxID=3155462 RepID=UPI0033DA4E28
MGLTRPNHVRWWPGGAVGDMPPAPDPADGEACEVICESNELSVREMRVFSRDRLGRWCLASEAADDIELVVSELVTNAVRHGRGPVRLRLTRSTRDVCVEVTGREQVVAAHRRAGPDDESGRGLLIVAALSAAWGISADGRTVWSRIAVTEAGA